mmetsp:Transcript_16931/g.49325  ORF Transcript_16931/g.49325 Transcript_16931/m.49325 type:complete len:392 (+) Transcript_16931:1196-2371(+)
MVAKALLGAESVGGPNGVEQGLSKGSLGHVLDFFGNKGIELIFPGIHIGLKSGSKVDSTLDLPFRLCSFHLVNVQPGHPCACRPRSHSLGHALLHESIHDAGDSKLPNIRLEALPTKEHGEEELGHFHLHLRIYATLGILLISAVLVVVRSKLVRRKHTVGLSKGLELVVRLWVIRVAVRMTPPSLLVIPFLDFTRRGIRGHFEKIVVVHVRHAVARISPPLGRPILPLRGRRRVPKDLLGFGLEAVRHKGLPPLLFRIPDLVAHVSVHRLSRVDAPTDHLASAVDHARNRQGHRRHQAHSQSRRKASHSIRLGTNDWRRHECSRSGHDPRSDVVDTGLEPVEGIPRLVRGKDHISSRLEGILDLLLLLRRHLHQRIPSFRLRRRHGTGGR